MHGDAGTEEADIPAFVLHRVKLFSSANLIERNL